MEKEIGAEIRRLRRQKELTLDALASRTGLSKGYLSRLERGLKSPPISTLSNIVGALGVEIASLFQQKQNQPRISLVRSHERMQINRDGSSFGYYYEALAETFQPKTIEPFIITLTPNSRVPELFSHNGEEMIFVLHGEVSFIYGDEIYSCESGDCIYFDASVKHRADCDGSEEAKALVVIVPKGKAELSDVS